jgi:hypothetical protein
VWVAYGFEVRALTGVQDQAARNVLSSFGSVGQWIATVPWPAASYLSGLLWQVGHNAVGQPAYLFGQTSQTGWWYYFPLAMLIKMTLATLLLLAAATWFSRRASADDRGRVFSGWYVMTSFTAIMLVALPSKLNLGVRYVLPAITLLTVLASAAARTPMTLPRRVLVAALVLWHVAAVLRFAPVFLPYANEAFGGPAQLHRFLIDSNLDWGQDLVRVRRYLEANHITEYRFRSFTTAPARAYGLLENDVPTDDEVVSQPFQGVVIVGQSFLYYPGQRLEWLKRLPPTAVIGQATNVYDLR